MAIHTVTKVANLSYVGIIQNYMLLTEILKENLRKNREQGRGRQALKLQCDAFKRQEARLADTDEILSHDELERTFKSTVRATNKALNSLGLGLN